MIYVGPVLIGLLVVGLLAMIRDARRRFQLSALLAAGSSGIYLSGAGLGPWEFVPATAIFLAAYVAVRRQSWAWVGVAWLLHTATDIVHAVRGIELLPWAPHSALGCAICDPVIALWCFAGGRSVLPSPRRQEQLQ